VVVASCYLEAASLSMISQSTQPREQMAYLGLLTLRVAAQLFGCFVLLDAGPYRLEAGGVTSGLILPLGLMMDGGESQRVQAGRGDGR